MKLYSPCRCAWIAVVMLSLLFVSSPTLATDTPRGADTVETIADIGPTRQVNPVDARARVLLDDIIFRHEHIYFAFDSDELLPGARIALERKVEWLQKKPARRAIIEGHCDIRGTREYNQKLGQRRAQAVRAFLEAQGIEPQRIQIVTWGEKRPLVPQTNDTAWSWNRRAETRLQ
jgi:peptidoglycan-associated lipoprotein